MRKRNFFILLVVILLLSLITSCRSRTVSLPEFLSAHTPTLIATATFTPLPAYHTFTPTYTPAATDIPTATFTASPTPTPAVAMNACPFPEDCPGVKEINDYIPVQVGSGNTYTVNVPYDQPLSVRAAWVLYEPGVLDVDLEVLRFFFEIDGQDYARTEDVLVSVVPDASDSSLYHLAAGIGYVLDGLTIGEPHTVHIGYEFLEKVTDAGYTFEPGSIFHYTYIINPIFIPTATPTNTPIPQPTAVPPTPTVACELGTTIEIKNDTGAQVTMYFTGPTKYTFYIAPGPRTLELCSGDYSYTAYGCGGASTSGTAGDGDEIEFWCE